MFYLWSQPHCLTWNKCGIVCLKTFNLSQTCCASKVIHKILLFCHQAFPQFRHFGGKKCRSSNRFRANCKFEWSSSSCCCCSNGQVCKLATLKITSKQLKFEARQSIIFVVATNSKTGKCFVRRIDLLKTHSRSNFIATILSLSEKRKLDKIIFRALLHFLVNSGFKYQFYVLIGQNISEQGRLVTWFIFRQICCELCLPLTSSCIQTCNSYLAWL